MAQRSARNKQASGSAAACLAALLFGGCGQDAETGTPEASSPASSSTPPTAPSSHRSAEASPSATPNAAAPAADHVPSAKEARRRAACRDFERHFDVSYRVWWGWTDTGRMWWVELTWNNRTGKPVGGVILGDVRVTGLLPDAFGWSAAAAKPGPGRKGRVGWGGSSADYVEVAPGTSRQLVAPDADTDIHTTADGTFVVTDATATLYPAQAGPPVFCSLSVPERS